MKLPVKSECDAIGIPYHYQQKMPEQEVTKALKLERSDVSFHMVAMLQVGNVKLEAFLLRKAGKPAFGYDLFIKESADLPEWICYSCLNGYYGVSEEDMRKLLESEMIKHGLFYAKEAARQ